MDLRANDSVDGRCRFYRLSSRRCAGRLPAADRGRLFDRSGGESFRRVALGNVEITHGDLRDASLLPELLDGVDVVFHLACRGVRHSIGHPLDNHDVNAPVRCSCLKPLARPASSGFSTFVVGGLRHGPRVPMDKNHHHASRNRLGASKLAGECYARAYIRRMDYRRSSSARSTTSGPGRDHHEGDSGEVLPRFVVWAFNGRQPVIFGDGEQTRSFIYVKIRPAAWLRTAECVQLSARRSTRDRSRNVGRELADMSTRCHGAGPNARPIFIRLGPATCGGTGRRDQGAGPAGT